MMRLPQGGSDLDRTQALSFSYDGAALSGFAGDTLASALLGNGVRIVGRSFKYHRPRGVISAGIEEPSAILDLRHGSRHDPNARATIEPLAEGMRLSSVHAIGTAARDRLAVIDRFARFIPSAFYYKTFLWPRWMLFEPRIRAMAGLGRLDPEGRSVSEGTRHATVDVCVVGSGPAGLAAALSAAGTGSKVMLVELGLRLGGSLLHRSAEVDGKPGADWAGDAGRRLKAAGVAVLTRAMAFGLYDHNSLAVVERGLPATQGSNGERLWHVRARRIVLATGAIERPLLFGHNDLPGVMLADSALMYLRRYAVRAGSRAVVATGNDSAYETAIALRQAGAEVVVVDSRNASPALEHARAAGIEVRTGAKVETALGSRGVEGVRITDGTTITADLLAVSGGWSPALHLYCQAQGRPRWSDDRSALVPGYGVLYESEAAYNDATRPRHALEDLIPDGRAFIASVPQLVARLEKRLRTRLDYSRASLRRLDALVASYRSTHADSPTIDATLFQELTAYYGETLRRALNAEWQATEERVGKTQFIQLEPNLRFTAPGALRSQLLKPWSSILNALYEETNRSGSVTQAFDAESANR